MLEYVLDGIILSKNMQFYLKKIEIASEVADRIGTSWLGCAKTRSDAYRLYTDRCRWLTIVWVDTASWAYHRSICRQIVAKVENSSIEKI